METCYGCGAKAESHPIIGVVNKDDVKAGTAVLENPDEGSDFVGVPVCAACHVDPEHRTAHDLKAHFFSAGPGAIRALVMAGSSDLGSGPAFEASARPATKAKSKKKR